MINILSMLLRNRRNVCKSTVKMKIDSGAQTCVIEVQRGTKSKTDQTWRSLTHF